VIKDTLANLDCIIRERGAVVTHDALPAVIGNAAQLGQLLQNLIGNGIKYCEADIPAVHVGAGPQEAGEWLFSVSDNGIGIAEEFQLHIFLPFKRLHRVDQYEGTGLGLATCKTIVERHGGTIWCQSGEAGGSTFFFTLTGAP
jgi:light-regulated signal transduction histidine kinase (bacteriophytochrome)